ncbi:MAG: SpoIIE family protein phosphatase [Planctomycetota bacterium]|nr:SpoIIE family protein phosphatase [Planctomycetota bacterium]
MDRSIITCITSGESDPLIDIAAKTAAAWPDGSEPSFESITLERALADRRSLRGSAALILPDAEQRAASIYKLIDFLEETRRPIVLLTAPGDDRFESLSGDSVLTLPKGTDAAVLAAMLHALLVRQHAVDALVKELGASRRYQGGLCDEMGRMHEELQLAASVQQQMLPKRLPRMESLDFGVLFRPCGYVSGDIYDVKQLDEHHVGFFLADAVGHGVPAALMTMVLRRGLAMLEHGDPSQPIVSPSRALTRLNEVLMKTQGSSSRFATAVYGVVDARSLEVTLAAAGHPPPLRFQPDGPTIEVDTDGCLLGVFPDAEFQQVQFQLQPGELLLIYSDGFETAFPDGEAPTATPRRTIATKRYLDRFLSLYRSAGVDGVESAMKALSTDIDEQSGSLHQVDDLTAVAISACPVGRSSGSNRSPAAALA